MTRPRNVDCALQLLRLAYRAEKHWKGIRSKDPVPDMAAYIPFYKDLWKQAARSIDAEFDEIAEAFWRVRRGSESTLINNHVVQVDDPVILQIAGDKPLCHRLLANAGLPVPPHATYTLAEMYRAENFMMQNPAWSFVVKPAVDTSGGRGVTLDVRSLRGCRAASARASLYSHELLIEKFVAGECYRLLFLDGQMIDAVRQRGLWIEGDGRSTLGQLIQRKTIGLNGAIDRDADFRATMDAQRLTKDFVPQPRHRLLVKSYSDCNGTATQSRTAYDENATGVICQEIETEARRAVESLGARFATVELVSLDPTRSLKQTGGAII